MSGHRWWVAPLDAARHACAAACMYPSSSVFYPFSFYFYTLTGFHPSTFVIHPSSCPPSWRLPASEVKSGASCSIPKCPPLAPP